MFIVAIVSACVAFVIFVVCVVVASVTSVKLDIERDDAAGSTAFRQDHAYDFEPGGGVSIVLANKYHAETVCGRACIGEALNRGITLHASKVVRQPLYVHGVVHVDACAQMLSTPPCDETAPPGLRHVRSHTRLEELHPTSASALTELIHEYRQSIRCEADETIACLVFLNDRPVGETQARSVFKTTRCDETGKCIEQTVRVKPACGDVVLWVSCEECEYSEEAHVLRETVKHVLHFSAKT